jgi:hypothetical protein
MSAEFVVRGKLQVAVTTHQCLQIVANIAIVYVQTYYLTSGWLIKSQLAIFYAVDIAALQVGQFSRCYFLEFIVSYVQLVQVYNQVVFEIFVVCIWLR